MSKKSLLFLSAAVVLICALLLSGCGKQQTAVESARSAGEGPYVIGAIFSTTGDNAPLGVPEKDTVKMLEKAINDAGGVGGRQVKVEYYDDAGKPEQAVSACQELLSNKEVVAIIGPTLTGPSLAIAGMCENAGMPLISCAASVKIVDPVKKYVFKTAQTDAQAVEKLIDYLKANDISSVGFINDANAFGASGREQWQALSVPAGIKTVAVESFNSADTDMTSQLTKIKAAKPQAIICWGTNPAPAIVAKNAKRLNLGIPLFMSHGIANKGFIELAGSAADGVVFPSGKAIIPEQIPGSDPQKSVLQTYAADYEKMYQTAPNTFGGHAWDAFVLVVDALKEVGGDRDKIRDHIESRKEFVGISGVFSFSPEDHGGLDKNAFAIVQIKGGNWVLAE